MDHGYVCPENLRFTHDSIKNTFKEPYQYQRIDDTVDQIENNQLSPEVFMPLNVVYHRSVLWSLDNRRLWVLRKAGVPTVKMILVLPNYNRRSKEFFSSLSDPLLESWQYSSAKYIPCVGGGVRSMVNDKSGGAPRIPIRVLLHYPTTVAGAAQANRTTPRHGRSGGAGVAQANGTLLQSTSTPPPPPPRPGRDITIRSNVPPLVSPLPNASLLIKKVSDSLWGKILHVVNYVIDKGIDFFCLITSRSFDLSNEKVVTLGKNSFSILGTCFVLYQAYNQRKIIAVKAVVCIEKMVFHLLSKMFCFVRFVVRNAVDLSKGVVVGSGRKALDTCGVILSQCFSRLHFITDQACEKSIAVTNY